MPPMPSVDQSNLDESQKAFCSDACHTIRLLAPAGSGKTQSLLWRCLALHHAGPPQPSGRFLLLTFTRAARDELRDRLNTVPDFDGIRSSVEINTLNSWGYRWLRQRLKGPRLMTSTRDLYLCMMNVLRPIWETHERVAEILNDGRRGFRAARELMDLMDQVKGMGFRHDRHDRIDVFNQHREWLEKHGLAPRFDALTHQLMDLEIVRVNAPDAVVWETFQHFFKFWREATEHLYRSAILTFEDQKYWPLVELERALIEGNRDAGAYRYRHIVVDEFQDINTLDLNLLKVLARVSRCHLTIVGDDDQAIYEWRGATPQFILDPDRHIGSRYKTYILERNYRSPRNIVELAQRLIRHNKRRVAKVVRASSRTEAQIAVRSMATLEDSVAYVRHEVKRLLSESRSRRIALIGRKRSQIIPYQIVFAGDGIPFCAAEDLNVLLGDAFEQLKTILALRAQAAQPFPLGPDPVEALLRMCDQVKRYPLNKADRGKLRTHIAASRPRTLLQALEALYAYAGPLKGQNAGGGMSAAFYRAIKRVLTGTSVADTVRAISEEFEGLQKDYGKAIDDIFYTDPPFLYLGEFAARYGNDFVAFCTDIENAIASLAATPEGDDDQADPQWRRPLHLMTALRAKGKEFDAVFVLDCNQGIWPSKLATTDDQLEAERRLFYVAITRARQSLTLMMNQRIFDEVAVPSQYLQEMGLASQ